MYRPRRAGLSTLYTQYRTGRRPYGTLYVGRWVLQGCVSKPPPDRPASIGPSAVFLSRAIIQGSAHGSVDHRHVIAYLLCTYCRNWFETLWDPTNLDTKCGYRDVIANSPGCFVLGSHSRFCAHGGSHRSSGDGAVKPRCTYLGHEAGRCSRLSASTLLLTPALYVRYGRAYCANPAAPTVLACHIRPLHPFHLQAAGGPMSLPVFQAYLTTTCFLDRQLHNPVSFHHSHPHLSILVLLPLPTRAGQCSCW
ncbi:hypothetical protein F5B21DRAFT_265566 [Xylaria acuta]|nr:hypothetical protein F5B21DRAFT_265566 [Xylaria acuta]